MGEYCMCPRCEEVDSANMFGAEDGDGELECPCCGYVFNSDESEGD